MTQATGARGAGDLIRLDYARNVQSRWRRWRTVVLALGIVGVFVIALVTIVLKLDRRSPPHPREFCWWNLRAVAMATWVYDEEYGAFPPNLLALVSEGLLVPTQLHCDWRRGGEAGPFDHHYVAGLAREDPVDWIIALDDPANHPDGSGNIAYLDRSVRQFAPADFAQELRRFQTAFERRRGHPPTILGRDQPFLVPRKRLREQQEAEYREWLKLPPAP